VIRYRFYEAMSMARVPVLFCDDAVLPFSNEINYGRCSIKLKESNARNAGGILKAYLKNHPDDELIAMGRYGRTSWEKFLKREKWAQMIETVVRERLDLLTSHS